MNATKRITVLVLGALVLGGCSSSEQPPPTATETVTATQTATVTATVSPSPATATATRTITPTPTREAVSEAPVKPEGTAKPKGSANSEDRWSQIKPKALADECKKDGWSFERCRAFDKEWERRVMDAGREGIRKELQKKSKGATVDEEADSYRRQAEAGEPIEVPDSDGDGIPDDIEGE